MKVIFWHGCNERGMCKKTDAIVDKLESIGCYKSKEDDGRTWSWPDVLEKFIPRWNEKFLAMKDDAGEWIVFITQHGNFGQRG
jgi:hypothetical protein